MTDHPANSGYDVRNLDSLDKKYKCLICRHVLKEPVQMVCGHRICRACVLHENNIVRCQGCLENTLLSKIKVDRGFHNEMQILTIDCISCGWSGQLRSYQSHLEQSHNLHRCLQCNEAFSSLPLLEQHKQTTCSQMTVNCMLQPYGCNEQVLRCNLSEHYLNETHQKHVLMVLLELAKGNHQPIFSDTAVRGETIGLPSKVTTDAPTASVTSECSAQEEYIDEIVNVLSSGVETLNNDIQRLSDESLQHSQSVESVNQSLAVLKTSVEETSIGFNALNMNMAIIQQECLSLKQKIQDRQSISYDGTLIWKITNVQEKLIDAQSERQVSIYSPPFFSSPTGYKMCARLYLYGDGNARHTHMSMFFVLMRSSNDSLLQFPFGFKVIFCLFDQTVQGRHIIDSFRPDTRSSSFQRPRCEMNIASGIPKFVPISKIQQADNPYIKNDTMFIRIMVDFEDLPKTMLPYVVSLNPGLPMHFQQQLIQQEMKRREQEVSQTTLTSNEGRTAGNSQEHSGD